MIEVGLIFFAMIYIQCGIGYMYIKSQEHPSA